MNRLTRYIGSRAASAGDMGNLNFVRSVIDRLAAYEDTGLEPGEIPTGLELANVFAAIQELKHYKDAEKQAAVTWNTRTDPEKNRLQHENEQLRELVRRAVEDMTENYKCHICRDHGVCIKMSSPRCGLNYSNFTWQHADKLQELGILQDKTE